MARLNDDQRNQKRDKTKPQIPGVNIAGDYSIRGADRVNEADRPRGADIAPDAMTESDYEGEAADREAMETIEPRSQNPMSPADSQHMRDQREQVKREILKASSQTQSTLGARAGETRLVNPSSNRNVNTDWPVDE
jgi:hypothetical protein